MAETEQAPQIETLSEEKPPARFWNTGGRVLIVIAVLGLMGLVGWRLYQVQKKPLEKGLAPDFSLTSFEGKTYTLSKLRGKVVIINFWASWCLPCREEAAYLEQTWRKYKDKDVVFLGVDWVDTPANAQAYIKEFDITYPNGPDVGTKAAQEYRIQGVPETFYVDRKGMLRGVQIGPLKAPELDNKIDSLLAEQ